MGKEGGQGGGEVVLFYIAAYRYISFVLALVHGYGIAPRAHVLKAQQHGPPTPSANRL